jgi:hypothetical protein
MCRVVSSFFFGVVAMVVVKSLLLQVQQLPGFNDGTFTTKELSFGMGAFVCGGLLLRDMANWVGRKS